MRQSVCKDSRIFCGCLGTTDQIAFTTTPEVRNIKFSVKILGKYIKRIVQVLLAALGLSSGCSHSDIIMPNQFTLEFADALRKANPGLKLAIVRDLEVRVTSADGHGSTSFLNNAYDLYKQDPKSKADVIQRFVVAGLESFDPNRGGMDRTRIVPVIKDRAWLEETRQVFVSRGAKKPPEWVYEDLNPDLVVFYVQDSPKSIRYLELSDLELAKIERSI